MLSTAGMTWEEMMSAYDARRLVEQNFDFDKTAWRRFGTGDPTAMLGREFIRFVSLILKCHLNHLLRSGDIRQGPS
ncbi:unknown [Methanoculleus sp. CAG:1088]|nr:unknown [Methanoculleus sp. CAG:1088]